LLKKAIAIASRSGREKSYALTPLGREQLKLATNSFCKIFFDILAKDG
ncbi:hypothetical protein HY993_01010, partial [Candidatus Micrarchaeota archaeon]|nr:hypothetical protein [Candidatus Micrarchaeota archaeon]